MSNRDHANHDHAEHAHAHTSGNGGFFGRIFRRHSHDHADSIDSELAGSAAGIRAVKISLAGLGATALLQVVIVAVSGSVALLADTIHNFSDALTAIPLWIAFAISARAASRRYSYGYGRAEDLAGAFVVLMIAASAAFIGYESFQRLADPQSLDNLGWVAAAGVFGFLGNEAVAQYRIRVGRQIGSAALIADGHHARTDGFTSLAVVLAAACAWLGLQRADPLIGLGITVAILFVLKDAASQMWHRLMDAVDPAVLDEAERAAHSVDGVVDVSTVRSRWLGHAMYAEMHVTVDRDLSVAAGHQIAEEVEHAMIHALPKLAAVTVHVDPCSHDGSDARGGGHARHHAPNAHAH